MPCRVCGHKFRLSRYRTCEYTSVRRARCRSAPWLSEGRVCILPCTQTSGFYRLCQSQFSTLCSRLQNDARSTSSAEKTHRSSRMVRTPTNTETFRRYCEDDQENWTSSHSIWAAINVLSKLLQLQWRNGEQTWPSQVGSASTYKNLRAFSTFPLWEIVTTPWMTYFWQRVNDFVEIPSTSSNPREHQIVERI